MRKCMKNGLLSLNTYFQNKNSFYREKHGDWLTQHSHSKHAVGEKKEKPDMWNGLE